MSGVPINGNLAVVRLSYGSNCRISRTPDSRLPPKRQHPGTYESPKFNFHFTVANRQYDRILDSSKHEIHGHTRTHTFFQIVKIFFSYEKHSRGESTLIFSRQTPKYANSHFDLYKFYARDSQPA